MSLSSTSSAVDALQVRDVDGQYRLARSEEVLSQARRVLSSIQVRAGPAMAASYGCGPARAGLPGICAIVYAASVLGRGG